VGRNNDEPWEDQPTTVQDVPVQASVRVRTKKPFALEQVAGPGAPSDHLLVSEETIVGRSLQANISIDGNGISRQHVAIRRTGPEYTFTDLNSANGVYLNGIKTYSAILREGDMLQLGDAVFVFHEGS
jgi:pSer/pThr/pTyr-binding forkhead associated (FHA) protein